MRHVLVMEETIPTQGDIRTWVEGLDPRSIKLLHRGMVFRSVGFQGWNVVGLIVVDVKKNGVVRVFSNYATRRATQRFAASIVLRLRIFNRRSPGWIGIIVVIVLAIICVVLQGIMITSLRLNLSKAEGIVIDGRRD